MKKCSTCGLLRRALDFHADRRARDGLRYTCKFCARESGIRSRARRGRAPKGPGGTEWAGLGRLSDQMLVGISLWSMVDYALRSDDSIAILGSAILREGERRGWPDGWREDPSVIPSIAAGTDGATD